ncbi:MAG: hypothetical protein K2X50_00385 [Gammaproteobacteria bacterium]|nr:hypothetical protein [Gammaproteobacteria bacterium]
MIDIIEHWNNCLGSQEVVHSSTVNINSDHVRELADQTIQFIGQKILANGETVTLDWGHFEDYVLSKLDLADPLNDFVHPHILIALIQHAKNETKYPSEVKITLDCPQSTLALYYFLQHILPIKYPDYPSIKDQTISVNLDQHFFITRTLVLGRNGLTSGFSRNFYLKTLRADTFDFTSTFLTTLFNADEEQRALQNLRPKNRGAYIIDAEGKIISRLEKKPNHIERKQGFTQIQSVTFIDDMHLSSAFGYSRREKLYGLMTHQEDMIVQRFLKYDAGTISRPFETDDLASAHRQAINFKKFIGIRNQFHADQLDEFEKANMLARALDSRTNEVLARLRFNPHRSYVSICANSLNSRLLAFDFAEELLERFTTSMLDKGHVVNQKFTLPIVIYLKPDPTKKQLYKKVLPIKEGHELSLYSKEMRQQDHDHCHRLYKDKAKRYEHYKKHDFEFLLGLDELIPEVFLDRIDCYPLALFMLETGYARMLMRLLRPARLKNMSSTDPNLSNIVFDKLLQQGLIVKNDKIISELIRIEAFELAKKLIDATNTKIMELEFREVSLKDFLIKNGNPRQIIFVGLNDLLLEAASNKHWITVRLCLKEIKQIDKSILDELLSKAIQQGQYNEIVLLLKRGAGNDAIVNSAIFNTTMKKIDWLLIELFIRYYKYSENVPEFGRALILALRNKKFKLARELFKIVRSQNWREFGREKYQFQSTLFYVVKFSLNDLLEQSYQHEMSHEDDESTTRLWLAFDLARALNNITAIEFLQTKMTSVTLIDPKNMSTRVCRLVFEAYFLGEKELAEWRLFYYGHQYNVLPEGCHDVLEGLKVLLVSYGKVLPTICKNKLVTDPFLCIANIYLYYYNHELYKSLRQITETSIETNGNDTESVLSLKLLDEFSLDQLQGLKDIIKESTNLSTWLFNLSRTLGRIFPQEYYKSTLDRENEKLRIDAHIELIIYILDIISLNSSHYNSICSIFKIVFELKHQKAIHAILSNSILINNIGNVLLSTMIEKPIQSNGFGYKEFNHFIKKYSFSVKKGHVQLAIKEGQYWKITPLLNAMDDKETQNPENFWDFFEIWLATRLTILANPNNCVETLIKRLGPNLNAHYTLLYIVIILESTFKQFPGPWSFQDLSRLNISYPFRTITDNIKTTVVFCDTIDERYWAIQKRVLTILDNYFSHFSGFDTLTNEKTLVSTYNNLLWVLNSVTLTFSFDFFKLWKGKELTSELHKLLSEANELLIKIEDSNTQKPTKEPDPADIVLYL